MRLRKYVVTENEQVTVPVSREEVRVEREPITDSNMDAATSGPEITESEHEVVTYEERPVVAKETVPKERVRLEKDTVTEQKTVSEEVRKERIEVDGDDKVKGRGADRRPRRHRHAAQLTPSPRTTSSGREPGRRARHDVWRVRRAALVGSDEVERAVDDLVGEVAEALVGVAGVGAQA